MKCKNKKVQDTCGIKLSSACVVYEGYLPSWSSTNLPSDIEFTTSEIYKEVEKLKQYVNTENPTSNVKSVNNVFPNQFGNISISTSNILEGDSLYFTTSRSRNSISETIDGITYNNSTGVFSLDSGRIIPIEANLSKVKSVNGMVGDVIISTTNIKWIKKEW